jgi:hypothetical protein
MRIGIERTSVGECSTAPVVGIEPQRHRGTEVFREVGAESELISGVRRRREPTIQLSRDR